MLYNEHLFAARNGGVVMTDHVIYAAPHELVGNVVNGLWVKHRLAFIFDYRREKIKELFGELLWSGEPL